MREWKYPLFDINAICCQAHSNCDLLPHFKEFDAVLGKLGFEDLAYKPVHILTGQASSDVSASASAGQNDVKISGTDMAEIDFETILESEGLALGSYKDPF